MLRQALVVLLALTTAACTGGGGCRDINADHDTRAVLLDRASGAITWSVAPLWTGDLRVRAVGEGFELVGSDGTDRYDDAGARISHEDAPDVPNDSPITVAALNARRERWQAVPVGAPFPSDDRAAVTEASSLPTGPARTAALAALDLHDVHGDLWFGGLRSTTSFRDGRVQWRREPLAGTAVTSSGAVVVLQQVNRLLAVRQSDGSPVWRRGTTGAWSVPALVTPRGLLAAEGSRSYDSSEHGRLHQLDVTNGRSRWMVPLKGRPSSMVLDRTGVVVGSSVNLPGYRSSSEQYSGAVAHLDAATGKRIWAVTLSAGPVVAVVPLTRGLVAITNDETIFCD